MPKIPDKIDVNYLRGINPPSAAAANVATTLNAIIDFLIELQPKLDKLTKATNEIDTLEKQYKTSSDA